MDVAGFIDLLTKAGLDVTPLEAAEALWLARYATPPAPDAAPPGQQGQPQPPTGPATTRPVTSAEDQPPGAPAGEAPTAPREHTEPRLELRLPAGAGARDSPAGASGVPVQVPASTALPGALGLFRALRPLKARAPDRRRRVLDEAGTADASARVGSLFPVFHSDQAHPLSLVLVTDTGPAMSIWAKLADELTVLLERLGAFRNVQRWYLRTAHGALPGVSRSVRASAAIRDPAELRDPAGRQLTLLLTDGAGSAWYSGAIASTLWAWGTSGPVAILQPLPQQLWPRTGLAPVRGRLTSGRQAAPNAELAFTPYERAARWRRAMAADLRPVPVPVLEIRPDWLRGWARFLTGPPGATLDCAATLAAAGQAVPVSASQPTPADGTAEDRLRHFAEQASPEARRLASYLAAAPLSLPVIRHVQQALLPESGPAHLAEVLLGGIIITQGVPGGPGGSPQWRYEFAPGVRDLLLNGLGRSDARRVLATVSRDLTARFGVGADEFAAVAAPAGAPTALAAEWGTVPAASRPFAEVARHLIERITGQFSTELPTAAPPAGPDRPGESADMLIRRYRRTGTIADIDAAIARLRETGGVPGGLATALRLRYLATGEVADLDEAAATLRRAGPAYAGPALLEELAEVLALRHARTNEPADLREAIVAASEAVRLARPRAAEFARCAGTLGELLLRQAQAGGPGPGDDLDGAVAWLRAAVEAEMAPADHARLLAALSTALRLRAVGTDLDAAVSVMRRAIDRTPRDPERMSGGNHRELAARYAGLAAALLALATAEEAAGEAAGDALREAADSYRAAVAQVPDADDDIAPYLTGRGIALRELALVTGAAPDLAEAVRSLREAIGQTRADDPELPARQAELASALVTRFGFQGHRGDLVEARYLLTEAVTSLSSTHGSKDPATLSARLLLARTEELRR